jgi:hypothetical protein
MHCETFELIFRKTHYYWIHSFLALISWEIYKTCIMLCSSCKNRRFGECIAIIRVTRIRELGTMLAVTRNCYLLPTLFLASDSFYLDDGGDTSIRNVGLTIATRCHARRRYYSQSPPWKPQILHNINQLDSVAEINVSCEVRTGVSYSRRRHCS